MAVPALAFQLASSAFSAEPFPSVRPATRAHAVAVLSGGADLPVPCLSTVVQSLLQDPAGGTPSTRRALGVLQGTMYLPGERRWVEPDGTTVRFTRERGSFDRLDATDQDADGRPDVLEGVLGGLGDARRLLVGQLGLSAPGPLEVLLVNVGGSLEGYVVPAGGTEGRTVLVLDASPEGGVAGARRAAIHQFAHVVGLATGSGVPPAWAEAFATWAVLRLEQGPDRATADLISSRLDRLSAGLVTEDLDLAAGNAVWFSFLEEAYGPTAMRLVLEELGAGSGPAPALDRALRRSVGETFAAAFRDFQVWTLLVGDRSNGQHLSFADRLASPRFASTAFGLPVLSVQADPPVGPLGAARVLLNPEEGEGGLAVRFEGESPGRWEADLLLVREDRSLTRLRIPLMADGSGGLTLPLSHLDEAVLLVRNLDSDAGAARRYTWWAHRVQGYPFELASVKATPDAERAILVSWETRSEHRLVGFNVLRTEEGTDALVRVNPVWVPAIGDETTPASYQFVDATAVPDAIYSYRIEAITEDGLTSRSQPVSLDGQDEP